MIETERLQFRKYTMDDLDFYASMVADPEMMRYIGHGNTRTREEAADRLQSVIDRYEDLEEGLGLLLAIRKSDGHPVGNVGLIPFTLEGRDEIEVGYWIARDSWGLGYATEAAAAFRDAGWQKFGLQRLVSMIQPDNHGSIGVSKKIGMHYERDAVFNSKTVALYSIHR